MSWVSKLKQLTSSAKDSIQHIVVIQGDAVYVARAQEPEAAPKVFPISNANWESALKQALKGKTAKGQVAIVLGGHLYESYQLEKPNLPEDEWAVALPFLLKDLITEKATDIVADASVLPDGQRVQAYVLPKRILQAFVAICDASSLVLHCVVPEEELWARTVSEQDSFLLLRRNAGDTYKLSAYVAQTPVFNRSLRNVVAPITGPNGTSTMFDALALDIQRSADYLASTFSQSTFRHLFLCCDEDKSEVLINNLQDIVNPTVQLLTESQLPCGHLLCQSASALSQVKVNLYPSHLKPQPETITLDRMVALWVVTAVLFAGLAYYEQQQTNALKKKLTTAQNESALLQDEKSVLQQKLASHTPTQTKLDAAIRIEADIEAKRNSLKAVAEFDDAQKQGFSGIMRALAAQARSDISLQTILITDTKLNLSGVASSPVAIPSWVQQFKKELSLVGRTFESLNIGRNEENVVTFELRASKGDK